MKMTSLICCILLLCEDGTGMIEQNLHIDEIKKDKATTVCRYDFRDANYKNKKVLKHSPTLKTGKQVKSCKIRNVAPYTRRVFVG